MYKVMSNAELIQDEADQLGHGYASVSAMVAVESAVDTVSFNGEGCFDLL